MRGISSSSILFAIDSLNEFINSAKGDSLRWKDTQIGELSVGPSIVSGHPVVRALPEEPAESPVRDTVVTERWNGQSLIPHSVRRLGSYQAR